MLLFTSFLSPLLTFCTYLRIGDFSVTYSCFSAAWAMNLDLGEQNLLLLAPHFTSPCDTYLTYSEKWKTHSNNQEPNNLQYRKEFLGLGNLVSTAAFYFLLLQNLGSSNSSTLARPLHEPVSLPFLSVWWAGSFSFSFSSHSGSLQHSTFFPWDHFELCSLTDEGSQFSGFCPVSTLRIHRLSTEEPVIFRVLCIW